MKLKLLILCLGLIVACSSPQKQKESLSINPKASIEFRLVAPEGETSCEKLPSIETHKEECVESTVWLNQHELTGGYVVSQEEQFKEYEKLKKLFDKLGNIAGQSSFSESFRVGFNFTEEGTKKLGKLTRENKGRRLALVINKQIYFAPTIMEEINIPSVEIDFGFMDPHLTKENLGMIFNISE